MCVLYTNLLYSSQRAPRELYPNVLLTAGPAGKDSLMVVQMCYVGSREKGQEYFTILSQDGERCLLNEVDEKSFFASAGQRRSGVAWKRYYYYCCFELLDQELALTANLFFLFSPV